MRIWSCLYPELMTNSFPDLLCTLCLCLGHGALFLFKPRSAILVGGLTDPDVIQVAARSSSSSSSSGLHVRSQKYRLRHGQVPDIPTARICTSCTLVTLALSRPTWPHNLPGTQSMAQCHTIITTRRLPVLSTIALTKPQNPPRHQGRNP